MLSSKTTLGRLGIFVVVCRSILRFGKLDIRTCFLIHEVPCFFLPKKARELQETRATCTHGWCTGICTFIVALIIHGVAQFLISCRLPLIDAALAPPWGSNLHTERKGKVLTRDTFLPNNQQSPIARHNGAVFFLPLTRFHSSPSRSLLSFSLLVFSLPRTAFLPFILPDVSSLPFGPYVLSLPPTRKGPTKKLTNRPRCR